MEVVAAEERAVKYQQLPMVYLVKPPGRKIKKVELGRSRYGSVEKGGSPQAAVCNRLRPSFVVVSLCCAFARREIH